MPGVLRMSAGRTESLDGSTPEFYQVAETVFESRETALAALGSPEGQAAAADIGNFADGGFVILFSTEELSIP
jgi:uncharacterized protein (TIGR02118 family)